MPDATIADITVVLDQQYIDEPKTAEAVSMLKAAGMDVRELDDEESVVEGSIESSKVKGLEKLDCVDYVRVTFTYEADYPPGDPRDTDGQAGLE